MELNWETSNNSDRFSEFMTTSNENEDGIILGLLIGIYVSIAILF